MADANTTTYSFVKPEVGASDDSWGGKLNGNWDDVDDLFDGTTVVTGIKMDDTLSVVDNADNTKVAQFQASGITTATTRTFTFPDASDTLAVLGTDQTFSANPAFTGAPDFSSATNKAAIRSDLGVREAAVERIGRAVASSDATIEFTSFDASKYDSYRVVISNLIPATDDVRLQLRTSTDGGSTYDSGSSDYAYANEHIAASNTAGNGTVGSILLTNIGTGNEVGSAAGEDGVSMEIMIYGPHLSKETQLSWIGRYTNSVNSSIGVIGHGARNASEAVSAIQLLFSSGDIESGTVTLYGMRNA